MSYDEHLISMAGGDGDQLAAIEARAQAATPGPWKADTGTRGDCVVWGPNGRFLMNAHAEPHWIEYPGEKRSVSFDVDRRDAEFIAHARVDVPALLALVREQQAKLAEAWDEGFDRGFYDPLAGSERDASESLARNPYAVTVRGGE